MLRALYRMYLYVVWLALLIFAAGTTVAFLSSFLRVNVLSSGMPNLDQQRQLVQSGIFVLVAWIIAAGLGGLHYWLSLRDMREDPGAGSGAVRALALNFVQASSTLIAAVGLSQGLTALGGQDPTGAAVPLALGIVWLGVTLLIQYERKRVAPRAGAPLVLQRLHLYGVQFILLLVTIGSWQAAGSNVAQHALITGRGAPVWCLEYPVNSPLPIECLALGEPAVLKQIAWQWIGVVVIVAGVLLYGWMARNDHKSTLRLVAHYLGLAAGIICLAIAFHQMVFDLGSAALGSIQSASVDTWSFIWWGAVGALVVTLYAFWLARDSIADRALAPAILATAQALIAVILAFPFWMGWDRFLVALVDRLSPGAPAQPGTTFVAALALLLTGVPYIPFALRVRQSASRRTSISPRRALVLAGLAAGVLTSAASFITLIYTLLTALLSAALPDWQNTARSSAVALVVGLAITTIYIWRSRSERAFVRHEPVAAASSQPTAETQPATVSEDIEPLLRDLMEGRRSIEETANMLRQRGIH